MSTTARPNLINRVFVDQDFISFKIVDVNDELDSVAAVMINPLTYEDHLFDDRGHAIDHAERYSFDLDFAIIATTHYARHAQEHLREAKILRASEIVDSVVDRVDSFAIVDRYVEDHDVKIVDALSAEDLALYSINYEIENPR